MTIKDLFSFKSERIKVLHFTWFAFFVSFFAWFSMAPLATTMMENMDWLTAEHLAALGICNVVLTIPARIIIGQLLDKWGRESSFQGYL